MSQTKTHILASIEKEISIMITLDPRAFEIRNENHTINAQFADIMEN